MLAGASYRFSFIKERRYHRHGRIVPLLTHFLVPTKGLQWLAEEPTVETTPDLKTELSPIIVHREARIATEAKNTTDAVAPNVAKFDNLPLPFELSAVPDASDTETSTNASEVPVEEDAGKQFLAWLMGNLCESRAAINTPKARLHVLPEDLALVSPGICWISAV